jgi:hypothetical protein
MRFYRVVYVESNTSASNPTVTITSPTNGAALSGDVTISVSASSDEILSDLRLYVDGEEQWSSDDGTNFLINTCEWPNGPHVLFATAKSQSGFEGVANGGPITYGRSASPYVNATFANLITRLDLSQLFFQPALGQTQHVTAAFAAGANWTLEIQDANTNDVLYVSGAGGNMSYNWDGSGTNSAPLPDGVYSYVLTAQTNGQALLADPPPEGGDPGSPPTLSMSASLSPSAATVGIFPTSARQAIAAGLDYYYLQRPPMPPVYINREWVP